MHTVAVEEVFSQVDLLQEVGVDVLVARPAASMSFLHQSEYAHLLSEADRAVRDETALSVQSAAKQLACCRRLQHRSISFTEDSEPLATNDVELAGRHISKNRWSCDAGIERAI